LKVGYTLSCFLAKTNPEPSQYLHESSYGLKYTQLG
jgi:hypothetical protein